MDDAALEFVEDSFDPAVARAERRLRLLERLTQIGMELAEALLERTKASESGTSAEMTGDPADAYVRISRAVRLTIALEAKTDQELRDLKAGVVRERQERRTKAVEQAREAAVTVSSRRVDRARDLVEAICDAEAGDYEDFHGLTEALEERLEGDFAYADCDEWPLRQIVERLCKDLGLNPDWSCWTGEGWDEHYTFDRHRWDPFNRPSRRPVVKVYKPPKGEPAPETRHRQLE